MDQAWSYSNGRAYHGPSEFPLARQEGEVEIKSGDPIPAVVAHKYRVGNADCGR